MAKVQISIDDELLKRLDLYVARNYTTRSGALSMFCNQGLITDEIKVYLKTVAEAMKTIAENNQIDDESLQELRAFQKLVELSSGNVRQ